MITLPNVVRIFPLAEVVLFPDTLLPLHIFEPRYCELLADALDGDRTIAMVLVKGGAKAVAEEDNPELYPVGCAGRVVENKLLEDGRSMIVLRGGVKFRIKNELGDDRPYRSAEAQALYEAPAPVESLRLWRDELERMMTEYAAVSSGSSEEVGAGFEQLELGSLVNYLSASMPFGILEKQSLLECATPEARYARLCELIAYKTAEARLGLGADRGTDS